MRVYLPTTVSGVRLALERGQVEAGAVLAVDDALRRSLPDWSEEDLEYLVLTDAAAASLDLLTAPPTDPEPGRDNGCRSEDGPADPPLRAVIAVELPDGAGVGRAGGASGPGAAGGAVTVPWRAVAAVHLDVVGDAAMVRDAVTARRAALTAGSGSPADGPGRDQALGAVADLDLSWYDPSEIRFLLDDLAAADAAE
jgi:hypothetical protein